MSPQCPSLRKKRGKKMSNSSRLIKAFGLEENPRRCEEVKAFIRAAVAERVGLSTTVSQQSTETFLEIEKMLKNKYPDVFNIKEDAKMRMAAVKSYMSQIQSCRRSARLPQVSNLTLPTSHRGDGVHVPPVSIMPQQLGSNAVIGSSSPIQTKGIYVPSSLSPSPEFSPIRTKRIDVSSSSSTESSSSSSNPCLSTLAPSRTSQASTNNSRVGEVDTFLKSCVPPMGHFLQRFLEYGCRNERYLRGVSKWPKEEVEEMLRALPTLGGRDMSEMDIRTLRIHFMHYFR